MLHLRSPVCVKRENYCIPSCCNFKSFPNVQPVSIDLTACLRKKTKRYPDYLLLMNLNIKKTSIFQANTDRTTCCVWILGQTVQIWLTACITKPNPLETSKHGRLYARTRPHEIFISNSDRGTDRNHSCMFLYDLYRFMRQQN